MAIRKYTRMNTTGMGSGKAEVVAISNGHQRSSLVRIEADEALMHHSDFKTFVKDVEKLFDEHKSGEGELG